MQRRIAIAVCVALGWLGIFTPSPSQAQNAKPVPAPAPQPPPQPDQKEAVRRILRHWEQKTADIETLHVTFQRTSKQFDEMVTTPGEADLKSPNLAALKYFEKAIDPQTKQPYYEEYLFNGKELRKSNSREKKTYIYPIDQSRVKNGAIQSGPLRFLFNMKVDEAFARYTISLLPKQADPKIEQAYYVLKIVPNDPEELKEAPLIIVWLGKTNFTPGMIQIRADKDTIKEHFRFTLIERNPTIADAKFRGVKRNDWKEIYNPLGDNREPAGAQANKAAPRRN